MVLGFASGAAVATGGLATIVEFDVIPFSPQVENVKTTVYVERDRLRVEQRGEKSHAVLIYRGDLHVFWQIRDNLTYTEITPEDVKPLRAQLRDQVEQYEQYLSYIPDGEREIVEQTHDWGIEMLRRLSEERSWKKFSNEKVDEPVKVGKWMAQKYKRFYDGKFDDIEYWSVGWDQTGVTAEDFAVVHEMAKSFDLFIGDTFLLATMWNAEIATTVEGFPIRFVTWHGDSKIMRSDVTGIRKEAVDSTLFTLPEGLDETPFIQTE
jgi:hypothetical protein